MLSVDSQPRSIGRVSPRLKRGEAEQIDRLASLTEAFRPTAPIDRAALFAGRTTQLGDLFAVAEQPGQHAVVYGERGVGKTSVTTVAAQTLAATRVITSRTTCDRGDTFGSVWRKAFDEIQFTLSKPGIGFAGVDREVRASAAGLLADQPTPYAVKRALQALTRERPAVVFIDEFDRLASPADKLLFADAIKSLSDQLPAATVVLVGVADDVEELVAEHQSIERALVQIHMPRMSAGELAEIVTRGIDSVQMTIDREAVATIARVSQGLPHYAHLLGQIAARTALEDLRTRVRPADVRAAIAEAIEKTQKSVLDAYRRATEQNGGDAHLKIMLACALAPADQYGFFTRAAVEEPLRTVAADVAEGSFERHLDELADPRFGSALQKRSDFGGARYRFGNPLLQPYVLMRAVADGAVAPELLGPR